MLGASSNVPVWKLRVGSVPNRLKVSMFVAVPSSRYFAVAGPIEPRNGRMLRALDEMGPGSMLVEGRPFRVDLE